MSGKENLTPIKTLVFSMGFILMGGTVLLVGMVWKKIATENRQKLECAGGHVDLTGRGKVIGSDVDGKMLRMTLEKQKGKREMVMIDSCSGKTLGTLVIDVDAP